MKRDLIIFSTSAGHIIEYFDSYLYGYFAFMLAPIFFPSDDPTVSLISSFGAFAAGFVMRPLGGIFFGHLGDRLGRKVAFLSSILLISVPTFGIGCLPSYDTIGIAAPILLIIFRLLQGVSLGGEYGGAAIFIREHVQKNAAGFAGSLLAAIGFVGALAGTFVGATFTMSSMPLWAWRVPFFLGGAFGIVVYFLRRKLIETPAFQEIEKKGAILKVPIFTVFKDHFKGILSGVGIGMNTTIPYYLTVIYMNTQYKDKFSLTTSQIMMLSTSLMVLWVVVLPIAGYFSDKIGRIKLMAWSAVSTILAAFPLFYIMQETQTFTHFLACQTLICLTSMPYVATCSSVLPMLFPPAARYSGSAFSYSLGVAVFGGTAPLIVSWLVNHGLTFAPALYLMFAGLCGWIAVISINVNENEGVEFLEETSKKLAA
ncbi:MAG: MFS transporter [Alphaproteobacteria bacterium]|jgi:MHS family proline/betaine transporter-like MFS transporter|nr:MFS transporter [Alphaproteobacteria bacterium]MBP7729715.1 MFS transporter [Alphaproteobacteria bacterium]